MEYTKGRALLLKLYANSSLGDEFIGARKMGQVRSAAIRLSAARASRVASVRRLALDQAFDIWSCIPTIIRRTTDSTVVAALNFFPGLRDVLTRGFLILHFGFEKGEKVEMYEGGFKANVVVSA
ncbi:hypothetical protein EBS57_10590 [bacterium]|nr:hypothetical protein [bacterium]